MEKVKIQPISLDDPIPTLHEPNQTKQTKTSVLNQTRLCLYGQSSHAYTKHPTLTTLWGETLQAQIKNGINSASVKAP